MDVGLGFGTAKAQMVDKFEKSFLRELLLRAEGNITQAAKLAGKERRALGKLIKKHGLDKHSH